MEPSTFLFIFIGTINLALAAGFIYYAFKNAFRLKGAVPQYLMTTGAFFFGITGLISGIGSLFFHNIYIVRYILFIVGFILISIGEIYSGRIIRKVIGKKPWLMTARTFSYGSYRSVGILIILLSAIPLWTLGIIIRPASIYGMAASLFITLGFVLIIIGEKKLYITTNVLSERATTVGDGKEINLLRDDMAAVRIYADIINTFLYFGKPVISAMIVNDNLNKWSEEHPVLFENCLIKGEGKIDTIAVIQNLDRLYEKSRLPKVLNEFSVLTNHLVNLYSSLTSSEYAKERLAEAYNVVKKQYSDAPIIFDILRTMPEDILDEEKLSLLSQEELAAKVKKRTEELVKINKELQIKIKEHKKAEEKIKKQNIDLQRLNRIKSEFLNITSHELRTPMTAMKGYIQMLLNQKLGKLKEEQQKALGVVLRNTNRLNRLIQDIIDTSQLESGTMRFIPEKTDMNQLIKEIVETLQPDTDEKGITITVDVESTLPKLVIDQDRIKQVCNNLVNNAIKFSPDGSIINVRAKKQKENVLIEVQDYGKGIPKDKQQKVFDSFYQVESGMDRSFGGTGLGLSISRSIVISHGGKIWLESKEGKGSTFRFTLPLKPIQDVDRMFKEIDALHMDNTIEESIGMKK